MSYSLPKTNTKSEGSLKIVLLVVQSKAPCCYTESRAFSLKEVLRIICKLLSLLYFFAAVLIGSVVIGGAFVLHHAGDVVLQVSKGAFFLTCSDSFPDPMLPIFPDRKSRETLALDTALLSASVSGLLPAAFHVRLYSAIRRTRILLLQNCSLAASQGERTRVFGTRLLFN